MNLVVLLHGYGSNASEMLAYFKSAENIPNTVCFAIESPTVCDLFPDKRQWFKLSYLDTYLSEQIRIQSDYVVSEIMKILSTTARNSKVYIIGHSQGAMIGSYIALNGLLNNSTSICISAMMPYLEQIKIKADACLSFVHGEKDDMLPIDKIMEQLSLLRKEGVDFNFQKISRMGHNLHTGLSEAALTLLKSYINKKEYFFEACIEPVCWEGTQLDLSSMQVKLQPQDKAYFSNLLKKNGKENSETLDVLIKVIKDQLQNKYGFCIVDGLHEVCGTLEEYKQVGLQLGNVLGTTVPQNIDGEHLVLVQDMGHSTTVPTQRGHRTSDALGFHNDRCDLILLICAHQSEIGGESTLVSAKYAHDYIRDNAPHYLEVLYKEFPNHRRGEERMGEDEWCMMPVFANVDKAFVCRFVKRFITDSQIIDAAPRLTSLQIKALDYMESVINNPKNHVRLKLKKGQMLLINNHTVLHGRTYYKDSGDKKRTMVRIWLSHKESRKLPESFKVLYRNTEAGAVRGGI